MDKKTMTISEYEALYNVTLPDIDKAPVVVKNPDDIFNIVKEKTDLLTSEVEKLIFLALDAKNALIEIIEHSKGDINKSGVYKRRLIKELILSNSCSFVMVHNHPSGNPNPSDEDKAVTSYLYDLGDTIEVPLLDHLVVVKHGYTSIKRVATSCFR